MSKVRKNVSVKKETGNPSSKSVMVKKYYENEVFIINKKDNELFEHAKKISDNIYSLIEELEFLRVDFIIENWN